MYQTILGISIFVSSVFFVGLRSGNIKPNYLDLLRHTCSDYKLCVTYSNYQWYYIQCMNTFGQSVDPCERVVCSIHVNVLPRFFS